MEIHIPAHGIRKRNLSLRDVFSEQGADLKEDVKAKILDQLAKLEKVLSKEEEQEPAVEDQDQEA